MKKIIIIISILLLFPGCGLYQQYQQQTHVAAQKALSKGNCDSFAYCMDELMLEEDGRTKIKKILEKNDNAKQCYISDLKSDIDGMNNKKNIKWMLSKIKLANKFGIINDRDATYFNEKLKIKVVDGNKAGDFQIFIGDNFIQYFHELTSNEHQKYIFDRTLNELSINDSFKKDNLKHFITYLKENNISQEDVMLVKSTFGKMEMSKKDLEYIQDYFPDIAEKRMKDVSISVCFELKNGDPIEKQDIFDALKEQLKGVIWFDSRGEGILRLVIERVRNSEKTLPDRKETVSYSQLQVNLVGAALLMPRNATYIYDIEYGGAEVEYGYVVSFFAGDEKTYENIVRGRIEETYQYCQNARIRNVFGGESPARFVANADMENRCNSRARSVSMDNLRRRVYSIISADVLKIPEIKKVYELNTN